MFFLSSGELSSVTVMEDVPESDIILIAEKFPPLLDVHKVGMQYTLYLIYITIILTLLVQMLM